MIGGGGGGMQPRISRTMETCGEYIRAASTTIINITADAAQHALAPQQQQQQHVQLDPSPHHSMSMRTRAAATDVVVAVTEHR
jgi:hypothetical protein